MRKVVKGQKSGVMESIFQLVCVCVCRDSEMSLRLWEPQIVRSYTNLNQLHEVATWWCQPAFRTNVGLTIRGDDSDYCICIVVVALLFIGASWWQEVIGAYLFGYYLDGSGRTRSHDGTSNIKPAWVISILMKSKCWQPEGYIPALPVNLVIFSVISETLQFQILSLRYQPALR